MIQEGGVLPTQNAAASLTKKGGCGDVYLYASNDADTSAVFVATKNRFILEGAPHERTFALPAAELDVTFVTGRHLTTTACNDAIEVGTEPVRIGTWTPVSGTATLDVGAPDPSRTTMPKARLQLRNVDLVNADGEHLSIPVFEISDVTVGWLAG